MFTAIYPADAYSVAYYMASEPVHFVSRYALAAPHHVKALCDAARNAPGKTFSKLLRNMHDGRGVYFALTLIDANQIYVEVCLAPPEVDEIIDAPEGMRKKANPAKKLERALDLVDHFTAHGPDVYPKDFVSMVLHMAYTKTEEALRAFVGHERRLAMFEYLSYLRAAGAH